MTTISPLLRRLRHAIIRDLEPEIRRTSQVAVLSAAGLPRTEIQTRIGATNVEMRDAVERVKRIAPDLDLPDLTEGL